MFVIPLTGQQRTEPYEFPVKPGTEEWAKLSTSKQMDEVCVIPEKILKSLTTEALLNTCVNYPRIIDFFLYDNLQLGFDICSKRFNGLSELLNRPDLAKVLLEKYKNIDVTNKRLKEYSENLSYLQLGFLELLISQDIIISKFNYEEKENLVKMTTLNINIRRGMNESLYRQMTTALILSRVLTSMNLLLAEPEKEDDYSFNLFNTNAIIIDTTIITKLLGISRRLE